MQEQVIDAHAHCGSQDRTAAQDFKDYLALIQNSPIAKVIMFAPVQEIYDRFDPGFQDSKQWRLRREQANQYILSLGQPNLQVIPFFFVWNDFDLAQLSPEFKGIKWHRHSEEPVYNYHEPACLDFLNEIKNRDLPVILEEELENTLYFIQELAPEIRVIIPHLGALNGGFHSLARHGIWDLQRVFTDTSLAGTGEIMTYIENYGFQRIFFGSDFPFGHPVRELQKIQYLDLDQDTIQNLCSYNVQRMLAENTA